MVGGAWIGGTVDSTGAVVLAGNALGELAGQVAALVKMIQNILIGFVAFAVAVFFTTKVDKSADQTVGASEIWHRFPKFILGFLGASLFFSFVFQNTIGVESTLKSSRPGALPLPSPALDLRPTLKRWLNSSRAASRLYFTL